MALERGAHIIPYHTDYCTCIRERCTYMLNRLLDERAFEEKTLLPAWSCGADKVKVWHGARDPCGRVFCMFVVI